MRIRLTLIPLLLLMGCVMVEPPVVIQPAAVNVFATNHAGASCLLAFNKYVLIGHNTYDGSGALSRLDTATNAVGTVWENIDVAVMAAAPLYHKLFVLGPSALAVTDTEQSMDKWAAETVAGVGGGADMVCYNNKIYIVKTSWSPPYDNTLFIVDAQDNSVTTINLDAAEAVDADTNSFTKLNVNSQNGLVYLTDTYKEGKIISADLNGLNVTYVTTTNSIANGKIYFKDNYGYVAVGAGLMGVHRFNVLAPGVTTEHFLDSALLSAQFLVFQGTWGFVTKYAGGVYYFLPGNPAGDFTVLGGTDPYGYSGLQDILEIDNVLYVAVNNYPHNSAIMRIDL